MCVSVRVRTRVVLEHFHDLTSLMRMAVTAFSRHSS